MASDVFIEYSGSDRSIAGAIQERLRSLGYATFWDREIPIGKSWSDVILGEIMGAKCCIALWSRYSKESDFLREDARLAADRGILVNVLLEGDSVPMGFGKHPTVDLSRWLRTGSDHDFRPLLAAIEALAGTPDPDAVWGARSARGPSRRVWPPSMRHDVFISYKKEEREVVSPYAQRLADAGLKIWWDVMIGPGEEWGFAIDRALVASKAVVVFWTPRSVESKEVWSEANHGLGKDALFPILLRPCEVGPRFQRVQWADLTGSESASEWNKLEVQLRSFCLG